MASQFLRLLASLSPFASSGSSVSRADLSGLRSSPASGVAPDDECVVSPFGQFLEQSSLEQSPRDVRKHDGFSGGRARRVCSVGTLSLILASGVVQAQTLPTVIAGSTPPKGTNSPQGAARVNPNAEPVLSSVPGSGVPSRPANTSAAVSARSTAVFRGRVAKASGERAIDSAEVSVDGSSLDQDDLMAAASVPAYRYRSVRPTSSSAATSSQSSQSVEDALIGQMAAPVEPVVGVSGGGGRPSALVKANNRVTPPQAPVAPAKPLAISAPVAVPVPPSAVLASKPSLRAAAAQPLKSTPPLPSPPAVNSAANSGTDSSGRDSAARVGRSRAPSASPNLLAGKDMARPLGVSGGAPQSSVSRSAQLPLLAPAPAYPGHDTASGVYALPAAPSVVGQALPALPPGYGQVAYPQPGYVQPGYVQPGYVQQPYAQPGYPQPYVQPGYPPVQQPYVQQPYVQQPYAQQAYPPGYGAPPLAYPAAPASYPYYYVVYPAPGMPPYMMPGAPGYPIAAYPAPGYPAPSYPVSAYPAPGYPAPGYAAPGYPAPGYAAPGYPMVAGGYPQPYAQQPYVQQPYAQPYPNGMGYPAAPPDGGGNLAASPMQPMLLPPPPAPGSYGNGNDSGNRFAASGSAPVGGELGLPPGIQPGVSGSNGLPLWPASLPPASLPPAGVPPLDPQPVLAAPAQGIPGAAVGGPLDEPTPFQTPNLPGLPAAPAAPPQEASLPQFRDGQLLRTSALSRPQYALQGVFLTEGSDTSARARLTTTYPLTSNLLFGSSLDVASGESFSGEDSVGFSVNELYASASLAQLPNLRFAIGQLDLTSYFDRNSFAKDATTHFFNSAFQTNPALSAAGAASRTGLLMNWTATDNIELKAAAFSSDEDLGGFALDGFAGEVGLRYGNAIIRGSYVADRDSGNNDGFREIFSVPRSGGGTGLRSGDREQAFGVNAEWYVPNLKMGLFGRYGRYENLALDEGGDTFSLGVNFQDIFSQDDRIGLAYGRNLSNESLRRQFGINTSPDVLELFYDFRFLPNLRLGFSLQGRDELSEAVAGFRLKADFDTVPRGNLKP